MLRHPTTAQDNRILDRPHSFTLILPSSTCRRRFLFSRCRFLFTRWNTFALHYIRCKLESHDTDPLLRHSIKLDIGGVIMPLPLVASLLAAVSASLPDFGFFLSASIFLFLCPFVEIYGHTYKLQDTLGRTANTNHPALMLPETALRTAGFQGPGACSSSFLDLACFASRLVFGSKLLASWWPLGTCLSSLGSCSSSVGTVRPSWMKAKIYGHTHTHTSYKRQHKWTTWKEQLMQIILHWQWSMRLIWSEELGAEIWSNSNISPKRVHHLTRWCPPAARIHS